MEKSKVYVMLVIVLLFGVCLGVPLGSGSSFIVGINHWSHDTDNNYLVPTNTSVDVSLNNNSLLWANSSTQAGIGLIWNGATMQFDVTGSGGGTGDPWFNASAAYHVTSALMANWNTSFDWGNHSLVGYLTSTFWNRYGTILSPATDGDTVQLNNTLDMNGENITNANLFEYAGLNVDWNVTTGQFDVDINSTTLSPFEIETVAGTLDAGDLNSVLVPEDDDSYNVSEAGGIPPVLTININFTNVSNFDSVIGRIYYEGGQGHEVQLEIWRVDTEVWENYIEFTDMTNFINFYVPVFDPTDHINNTNVSIRFDHAQNGIPSHNFYIDYIVLIDGFTALTVSDHDGLGGRDNKNNHPWAFPTDASRNITGNVTLDENLTINGTYNLTVNATEILTLGNPGDIMLGNDTEYSMYPKFAGKINMGTALNPFNDGWFSGKITVTGGVDPPYVLFNRENLHSILARINLEIPQDEPSKWGGLVQWTDGIDMFALNPKSGISEQFVWKSDYDVLVGRVERLELLLDELLK